MVHYANHDMSNVKSGCKDRYWTCITGLSFLFYIFKLISECRVTSLIRCRLAYSTRIIHPRFKKNNATYIVLVMWQIFNDNITIMLYYFVGRYIFLMARRWVIVDPTFSFMPEACRWHKWKWRANNHSTEGYQKSINALMKSHYYYYYQYPVRTSNEQRTTAIGLWFIPRNCDLFHTIVVRLLQKQNIPCLHK